MLRTGRQRMPVKAFWSGASVKQGQKPEKEVKLPLCVLLPWYFFFLFVHLFSSNHVLSQQLRIFCNSFSLWDIPVVSTTQLQPRPSKSAQHQLELSPVSHLLRGSPPYLALTQVGISDSLPPPIKHRNDHWETIPNKGLSDPPPDAAALLKTHVCQNVLPTKPGQDAEPNLWGLLVRIRVPVFDLAGGLRG